MAAPAILLIELLEGVGSHEADLGLRLRALRRAGGNARGIALPARSASLPRDVAERIAAERPAEVWIAGSHASWARVSAELPRGLPRTWWPTVIAGSGGEPAPPADPELVGHKTGDDVASAALALAPVRLARGHAPVALWDGEFVLVPGPLEGAEGERLMRAFAAATAERPGLDLVILADGDEAGAGWARATGVEWRVHYAGPSPREAEHTWIATAAAVMLPTSRAVSAGSVLRVLAHGTPLVLDPAAASAARLARWLAAHGLAGGLSASGTLEAALERAAWMRAACAGARSLAERHEPDALGERLAEARVVAAAPRRDGARTREAA